MIMVQLYVSMIGTKLDFRIDENERISVIKKDIGQILKKKYGSSVVFEKNNDYGLFSADQQREMEDEETLSKYGIRDGARLIFI